MVAYRLRWWQSKFFRLFAFFLGFGLVYLPLFPYAPDSYTVKFLYAVIAGLFMLQTQGVLNKYLYEQIEHKEK